MKLQGKNKNNQNYENCHKGTLVKGLYYIL